MSSNVKDILDRINNLYSSSVNGSLIESAMELQKEIDRSKGMGYDKDKTLITIKNPESLNTTNQSNYGKWNIEYYGRDLSLEEDNYRWDVYSDYNNIRVRGYYIIERELIEGDWLNVRWGKLPVNSKERKEVIDKKRLRDKDRIQADMITAILRGQ
jgi:hypothetical protein